MKIKLSKLTVITTLITLLPVILGAVLYDSLPDVVVTHWGVNNEPNGWSPKWMACFGIPVFMAVLNLVMSMVTENTDKVNNTSPVVLNISRWIIPVLSLVMVPMTLFSALGMEMDIEKLVCTLLGILFTIIGNYMPKCRPNRYVGIRVPWTLASEENWRRTHRVGGYVWMIGGIVVVIAAWLGLGTVSFAAMLALAVIPIAYSFILSWRGI